MSRPYMLHCLVQPMRHLRCEIKNAFQIGLNAAKQQTFEINDSGEA